MTLLILLAQAADAPRSVPLDPLLRWLLIPGAVLAVLAFVALASYTAFQRRWFRNKESGAAELMREVLTADARQERDTATWILNTLGKHHEETKGFINRLYAAELRERGEMFQTAQEAHEMAAANRDTLAALQKALVQQGESLRVLPSLQETFTRFDRTMERVQQAMQQMTDRLARMEGAFESWDGRERRRDRDRGEGR